MKKIIKKYWESFITLIIAVIALIISIKGCDISKSALELSNKSLEISSKQFIQINKPFLTLKANRFSDSSFFIIKKNISSISINTEFTLKNLGNVAAIDIKEPQRINLPSKMMSEGATIKMNLPKPVMLGPNDFIVMKAQFLMEFENKKDVELNYLKFIDNNWDGIKLIIPIIFKNEIDTETEYTLVEYHHLKHFQDYLLSSELKSSMIHESNLNH